MKDIHSDFDRQRISLFQQSVVIWALGIGIVTFVITASTWIYSKNSANVLIVAMLGSLSGIGFFLLFVARSREFELTPIDILVGIYLLLVGLIAGSSPVLAPQLHQVWNVLGITILDPPDSEMYQVNANVLKPTESVPNGQLLCFAGPDEKPVFVTGPITIPANGGKLYLQELSTGRTSPAVGITPMPQ